GSRRRDRCRRRHRRRRRRSDRDRSHPRSTERADVRAVHVARPRMRRRVVKWLAIALVLVAGTARADRETAERYFRAGEKAFAAQNFAAAAVDFEEAYKALSLPEIAFS